MMTAVCTICHVIIEGPAVAVLDEKRQPLEWRALGERTAAHVLQHHPEPAARLLALVSVFTQWLPSHLFESSGPEYAAGRDVSSGILKDLLNAEPAGVALKLHGDAGAVPASGAGGPGVSTSSSCLVQTPRPGLFRRRKPIS